MVICALKIGGKRSFGSAAVYAPKLNLTLKVPKTLINQCFLTKNKNYNFGTYRIKIIVLIWSEWRDSNSRHPGPKVPSKLIHSLFGISEQVFSYLTSF